MSEKLGRLIDVEQASIKTVAVEIKALMIGKKQMTLSVFRQLPVEKIFDIRKMELRGVPWGYVNYELKRYTSSSDVIRSHIVWQAESILCRCEYLWPCDEENKRMEELQGFIWNCGYIDRYPSGYTDLGKWHEVLRQKAFTVLGNSFACGTGSFNMLKTAAEKELASWKDKRQHCSDVLKKLDQLFIAV